MEMSCQGMRGPWGSQILEVCNSSSFSIKLCRITSGSSLIITLTTRSADIRGTEAHLKGWVAAHGEVQPDWTKTQDCLQAGTTS